MKLASITAMVVAALASHTVHAETSIISISNCDDLLQINDNPKGHYELTANISCDQTFEPISYLKGELNGNGFTLSNLKLMGTGNVGLFAQLRNATVRNLTLSNISVTGTSTIIVLV